MCGCPPLEPPDPRLIMPMPASVSSGTIERLMPVSSRCEKVVGLRTPSSSARSAANLSEEESRLVSYSPGFDENGKACQWTSRCFAAVLKASIADALGHLSSDLPATVGPPQPARPLFSQSSRNETSHAFVRYWKGVLELRSSSAMPIARGMNVSIFSCTTQ